MKFHLLWDLCAQSRSASLFPALGRAGVTGDKSPDAQLRQTPAPSHLPRGLPRLPSTHHAPTRDDPEASRLRWAIVQLAPEKEPGTTIQLPCWWPRTALRPVTWAPRPDLQPQAGVLRNHPTQWSSTSPSGFMLTPGAPSPARVSLRSEPWAPTVGAPRPHSPQPAASPRTTSPVNCLHLNSHLRAAPGGPT